MYVLRFVGQLASWPAVVMWPMWTAKVDMVDKGALACCPFRCHMGACTSRDVSGPWREMHAAEEQQQWPLRPLS